jgi:hypothetical protein
MSTMNSCGDSRVAGGHQVVTPLMEDLRPFCCRKMPFTQNEIKHDKNSQHSLHLDFEILQLTSFMSWRGGSRGLLEAI